jgi:transposase
VKRFLQSKYTNCELLFFPFIKEIIAGLVSKKEFVLAIDGTDVGKSCGALLVSLVLGKRSLPLVWLVKKGNKGHFSSEEHIEILSQVANLLPTSIPITIVGDGEFDSCELQEFIKNKEWQYVLRTAKDTYIEDRKGDSYKIGELIPFGEMEYLWLENCVFTKKKYGSVSCLVWHSPKHKNPIYLVSNVEWAYDMMDYYKQRWAIETLFADIKSRGFNIHKTRIKNPEMLHNLLIMVAIAFYLCIIIGSVNKEIQKRLPKIFRIDRMNELSIFQIGRGIINYYQDRNLKLNKLFKKALAKYFCVRF